MNRLTFGVSASPFEADMAVKRKAIDWKDEYPQAAKAVFESFSVDDGLVGAETIEVGRKLQGQLQDLFSKWGFSLRKWKTSDEAALENIPPRV